MFRKIRKAKNELAAGEAEKLLKTSRRGVLAVNGDDGYPYAIPVNFLFCEEERRIYFHGARVGHKADSLRKSDKVCFTVVGKEAVKDEPWAPYVQSAVVFGRCRLIADPSAAEAMLTKLAEKYYPSPRAVREEIAVAGKAAQLFAIEIEHLSGKEIQER